MTFIIYFQSGDGSSKVLAYFKILCSNRLWSQICRLPKFHFSTVIFHRYSTENILTFTVSPVDSSKRQANICEGGPKYY